MQKNFEIREAKAEDFDELFRLFQQLQPETKDYSPKVKKFFVEMINSKNHFGFVAVEGGVIIGYMDVALNIYHFSFDWVARIETTIVDEKMRGKGIGTALLKKCEEKAREKGYKLVEVDSGFQRDDAHKFYEHNGYAKRGYLFWKNL